MNQTTTDSSRPHWLGRLVCRSHCNCALAGGCDWIGNQTLERFCRHESVCALQKPDRLALAGMKAIFRGTRCKSWASCVCFVSCVCAAWRCLVDAAPAKPLLRLLCGTAVPLIVRAVLQHANCRFHCCLSGSTALLRQ